ncbi:MAG: hypothetical protein KA354_02875 [Phycisphaerae bacterium]|nr:hypothetical protein [Phycisphaerae bacterium]
MRVVRKRRLARLLLVLVTVSLMGAGCKGEKFLAWGTSTFVGTFLANLLTGGLGGFSTTSTIERFCYENGQPVDCANIPTQ